MFISKCGKYFILCVILSVTLLSLIYNLDYYDPKISNQVLTIQYNLLQSNTSIDLKYILLWTNLVEPIRSYLREGNIAFKNRYCSFTNCYVTTNRQLLRDVADFVVILFHGRELPDKASHLPQSRSSHQKYIYANMESSARYPVCNEMYNSYFNWTWTYKLNSDEFFGYMSIKDKEGNVIGPKEEMHWETVEAMMPMNDTLKAKLRTKKIAAAWFVSNCNAPSGRDLIAEQLQSELAKYNMVVDIYGSCGTMKCPRGSIEECLRKLETDYYFYLSFKNSFADDYVTEKLLYGLNHYAVPVVYGGANYTRFMPEGIYLTAQQSRIKELAEEMIDIIKDKQKYYNFFKWHNHYSYHDLTIAYTIINQILEFQQNAKSVILQWIPSHIGIHGNEMVDSVAKRACVEGIPLNIVSIFSDNFYLIRKHCYKLWKEFHDERSREKGIWYNTIQPEPLTIPWIDNCALDRKDIVTAMQRRIQGGGHGGHDPPWAGSRT